MPPIIPGEQYALDLHTWVEIFLILVVRDWVTTDEGDFEKVSEYKYLRALIIENNEVIKI